MLKTFLGKFSGDQRAKLSDTFGCHWEKDADCVQCRECSVNFTAVLRRHHCRGCGGIYCESCLSHVLVINGENLAGCGGCSRGQTPGECIKQLAVSLADEDMPPVAQAIFCPLVTGAQFGSGKASSVPPSSGYFEFINKTDFFVCIKLVMGGNFINELSRPSFVAVEPQNIVNSHFDPNAADITLLVLFDNPNVIPADGRVVPHSSGKFKASACAAVENFRHIMVFKIQSQGRNVLLKLKPGGALELRKGTSMQRMGLLGVFTGSTPPGEIDFNTNATTFEGVYNSTR